MIIIIGRDANEGEQFAQWLESIGHTAIIGRHTGSYIDGVWTATDEAANDTMRALWQAYCDA